MDKKPKKRFIAGAICPQCQELDSIVLYQSKDQAYRECVSCHFTQALGDHQPPKTNIAQPIKWITKERK